jgi:DNA-binding CsgD family transcriptional regulator
MYELTPKEFETLICVVEGRRKKDIAKSLVVSHRTVEASISRILEKTNCDSRALLISRYFDDKENFVIKVKQTKREQIIKLLIEEEKKISPSAIAHKLDVTVDYVYLIMRETKTASLRCCERENFSAPI